MGEKENFILMGTSSDCMASFLSKQGEMSLVIGLYLWSEKDWSLCLLWLPCQVIAPGAAVEIVETDISAVHCKPLETIPLISKG